MPRAARAHSGPDPAVAGTCWFSTTRPSPRPGVSGGGRGGIREHYCAIRWALQQAGRAYGATRKGRESEADEKFRRGGFSCRVVSRDFLADFFVSPEACRHQTWSRLTTTVAPPGPDPDLAGSADEPPVGHASGNISMPDVNSKVRGWLRKAAKQAHTWHC